MIYAEIENGVCANTIEADPDFAKFANLVELPEGFGIGDYYVSGVWSHDPPTPITPGEDITWASMATSIKEGVDDV